MPLHSFISILECQWCTREFEGTWAVDLIDLQQMEAAPEADQECPHCSRVSKAVEYPGWSFFGEAG